MLTKITVSYTHLDVYKRQGYTIDRIHELTKIDPWFLGKLKNIVDYKAKLSTYNKVEDIPADVMREAKILGFSDFQIARFVLNPTGNMEKENLAVRAHRKAMGILPAVKRINTIASEHPELTNYLYMTCLLYTSVFPRIRPDRWGRRYRHSGLRLTYILLHQVPCPVSTVRGRCLSRLAFRF